MNAPRSSFLLALLAACGIAEPAPAELARVTDAPSATGAKRITLKAESVPDQRGVYQHPSYRHPRGGDRPDPREFWVAPLKDPGVPSGAQVSAWVTPLEPQPLGESPDRWRAALAAGLDGQQVTLQVAVRKGDRNFAESGWGAAIADAERRYGLQTVEGAPVLFFPSP